MMARHPEITNTTTFGACRVIRTSCGGRERLP
jgi:hypothetical protein